MKRFIAVPILCCLLLASNALADINYAVGPDDLADGLTFLNGQGGVPFGYDGGPVPPQGKPLGSNAAGGAPGFGDSAFYSDVQGSAAGGPRDYTSFRMSAKDIFGVTDVTISDLDEISYYTKWESGRDWQLKIYTEGGAPVPSGSPWYGYRFNFSVPSHGDAAWNLSSTDTNLMVSDIYSKWSPGYVSVPGAGTLSDLDGLYGDEKILFIDIIAGYATSSPPSYSYLDGVTISLDDGSVAKMNLVPVPGAVLLGMLGLSVAGARLRKKHA